jgi:hypothetical protein
MNYGEPNGQGYISSALTQVCGKREDGSFCRGQDTVFGSVTPTKRNIRPVLYLFEKDDTMSI